MPGRRVRLRHPNESPEPIAGFPEVTLTSEEELWRCHGSTNGPWWFASSGDGRFDRSDGRGTCYAADLPVIACAEALSAGSTNGMTVARADIEARRVSTLAVDAVRRCADVTDGAAGRFGVTREIHDLADYTLPQAWAAALDGADFGGIRYLATTHQPTAGDPTWSGPGAQGPGSWALFGDAGAHVAGPFSTGVIDTDLERALDRHGIHIEHPPAVGDVPVLQPPPA